jgi:uncharacterized protein YjbJ (UPF0337 family)
MNTDQVNGTIDEVFGKAKRKVGQVTGNAKLQVEGMAQQAKGKAENAWGKTKDVVCDAIENTDVHVEAHVKLGAGHPTKGIGHNKSK